MAVTAEIDRLSRRRQELWAAGAGDGEAERITARLVDLYEQKRHEDAQLTTGARRDEIVRRARVESELERLMAERSR